MVVKCGSASVTIYQNKSKDGYFSFKVRYFRGVDELRITRANLDRAREEAESAARNLATGELDVLTLRRNDRLAYVRSIVTVRRRRLTEREAGMAGWRGETTILSNPHNATTPYLHRES